MAHRPTSHGEGRAEAMRGNSADRGYGRRWRKASKVYLMLNPFCAEHRAKGRVAAATVVDHVVPHKGDQALFWDQGNWQSLCKPCHDAKTARGD